MFLFSTIERHTPLPPIATEDDKLKDLEQELEADVESDAFFMTQVDEPAQPREQPQTPAGTPVKPKTEPAGSVKVRNEQLFSLYSKIRFILLRPVKLTCKLTVAFLMLSHVTFNVPPQS